MLTYNNKYIKMKENSYDNESFFKKYKSMLRSEKGLSGAGEWPTLQSMLPPFESKRLLDLGCGYGWHCMYAIENGAEYALGLNLSEKMINEAKKRNPSDKNRIYCFRN